ncbi:MAG TPA: hypothetical protein VMN37_12165 [Gemmatimonadales bacterium]|nr:hypothetical protein [Gemmatimonadales bacterium]
MRNYWLRIFLGAFAIFAIGMVGVTLIRGGMARVHHVVKGDGPIEIPLAFIPFILGGERLGTMQRVVLHRETPRRVREVEVRIDLGDSLLARGLSGCRLASNFEDRNGSHGVQLRAARDSGGIFYCLPGDSTPADLVEFGEAVFQPGEVRVPLYLHRDLVTDLLEGFDPDSTATFSPVDADSIATEARRQVDSALAAAGLATESAGRVGRAGRRLGDSLRAAARAQVDSVREELRQLADTLPTR